MSATVLRMDGKTDFSGVERTIEAEKPVELSAFAKKIKAMINSGLIDAADAVVEATETAKAKAKAEGPKVKAALNRVIDFSIGDDAGDAFHAARERHREIARRRTEEFMKTTYVAHFPGQTLGERKKDLFADFKSAISDHKIARDQLHKMATDRQVVSVARHEH